MKDVLRGYILTVEVKNRKCVRMEAPVIGARLRII